MATRLTQDIDKPSPSLIHAAHLAAEGHAGPDTKALGQELSADLHRLSTAVYDSLAPVTDRPGQN